MGAPWRGFFRIGGQRWSYEVAVNRGGGVNFTDYEKYKRSRSGDVKLKTNEPLTSPFNACASIKHFPKAFCSQV